MKYSKELTEKICKLLKRGNTITTTCQAIGINKQTFYNWMEKKLDFFDAIKKAMAIPDKKVENALYKSATMGHRFKEKEFKAVQVGEKIKMIPVKVVTRVITPNVIAQIFWLKNRKPEDWKDRKDLGIAGDLNIKIITAVPRSNPISNKKKKKK